MRKHSRIRAFTLIEVMIAMLVLSIGLLGMAGITVVVLRSNLLTEQTSEATSLAADLMDAIRRQPSSTLPNCNSSKRLASASANSSSCTIMNGSGILRYDGTANSIDFWPAATAAESNCGVADVLGLPADTVTATPPNFDVITYGVNATSFQIQRPTSIGGIAGYSATTGFSNTTTVCDLSSISWPTKTYLRYYRTYQTSGGAASDRTIIVVILWKDRFGRWRHVHLSTQV